LATTSIAGREIHYERFGAEFGGRTLVFLHEGLGSVELWRDFPGTVSSSTHHPAIAYSRYGNGWSSPLTEPRRPEYMHEEALETLPVLIEELVGGAPILVGHSDGASIAIIYAGASYHPVDGLVLIAPHVFVEPETVRSISAMRDRFPESDMAEKMSKYHTDPGATFCGWADIWLSPAFRTWNIEEYLPEVHCPVLVIQGETDEYGTIEQLNAIERGTGLAPQRLVVPGAGHSPHLSHPDLVTDAVVKFIGQLR
jgi:pimeloyl-ACP methyl ester carboxylesterase